MAVVNTIQKDNKIIRIKSKDVDDILSEETKKIIVDLTDTMRQKNLVGMAAPQIGYTLRIFVSEIRETKYRKGRIDKLRVFINPRIIKYSKKLVGDYEGCGSVDMSNLFGFVERPKEITVIALNETGKEFKLNVGGLLSTVIQHEIDHLNGVLFTDKIEDTKKIMDSEEYIRFRDKKYI